MAEYIEKHKAVNLLTSLENEFQQFKPFEGFEHAMYRKLCETEIAIGKLPAADVVPVVHGRWEIDDFWSDNVQITGKCAACSEIISWFNELPNYCPNCGARMDGGADNA